MNGARTSSIPFGLWIAVGALAVALAPPVTPARAQGTSVPAGEAGDCNQNGVPDAADLVPGELALQSSRSFPAGEEPWAVAAGDLDGDGDGDLVTANRSSHDVSVLRNTGSGSFAAPASFAVGEDPIGVAAADLDGDQDLDLATANSGAREVSVLVNDSTGAFSVGAPLDAEDVPDAIAAGDLDGDGDMDLVAGFRSSRGLRVFWNDGPGHFVARDYSTRPDPGPDSIVVADFDRDGRLDLAVSGEEWSVLVLFNEGDHEFTSAAGFGAQEPYQCLIAAGDVDGDSDLDLIESDDTFAPGKAYVESLDNNGDRTFGSYAAYEAGYGPYGVAAGDLDGDGDADIVATNRYSSDLTVALSDGPDRSRKPRPRLPAGSNPRGVILSDLDLDGHLDAAVANAGSGDVSVFLVAGDGVLPSPDRYAANANHTGKAQRAEFALAGDFDGDTDLDVITLSCCELAYLRNTGYRVLDTTWYQDGGGNTAAAGDLDGDGDLDLAVGNGIHLNPGSGTLSEAVVFPAGGHPISQALSDLDGDGDLDLAVGDTSADAVSVLPNDGQGTFGDFSQFPAGRAPAALAAADLDRDGKPDIACANREGDDVAVLLNQGGGALAPPVSHPVGDEPRSLAAGDLDGDRNIDLATADRGADTVSVLLNSGAGAFGPAVALKTMRSPVSIAVGDLEGDGDLEIAAGNSASNTVSMFVNGGGGAFQEGAHYLGGSDVRCVVIGDLDGDGREDLLSTYTVWQWSDLSKDELCVLWNQTVPPASRDRDGSGQPDECESRTVSRLGARPDAVLVEGGRRAIAFAGTLEAASLAEDLVWKGVVFENTGPGDASALAAGARLYADTNRDGALDAGDRQLGSAAAFDRATQRVAWRDLAEVLARGDPEACLLVLDLKPGAPPAGSAAAAFARPRPFLIALCAGAILAIVFSLSRRLRRLAWVPALLLALSLAPLSCDGDGGGKPPAASSRELQLRLVEVEAVGVETGLSSMPEGLPVTAWAFDA